MKTMAWRGAACALALAAGGSAAVAADRTAAPTYGAWGFDLAGRDPATRPGDDFFRYANGRYQDRLVIPADKPGWSLRLASTNQTEQNLRDILQAAAAKAPMEPRDEVGKIGAFYASFMDEGRIEKIGAQPMAQDLAAIARSDDRSDIAALMGATNASFQGSIFGIDIYPDAANPDRYVTYLGQAGLGLPDRDYYLEGKFAAQKTAAAEEAFETGDYETHRKLTESARMDVLYGCEHAVKDAVAREVDKGRAQTGNPLLVPASTSTSEKDKS